MLALTIYIMGTRKILPHEGKKGQRFLREAYKDAAKYFCLRTSQLHASTSASASASATSSLSAAAAPAAATSTASAVARKLIGFGKACYLHSHFYCNIYDVEEKEKLDAMWLNPILQVGEVVAGDEKLFHYTACHMNTKAVPQKKDVSFHQKSKRLFTNNAFRWVCGSMS